MDDGMDVASHLVDLAMNEALEGQAASLLINRVGVEVELQNVLCSHEPRGQRARHQETAGVGGMPDAHMPRLVEHPFAGQDAICGDQIFDMSGHLFA